MEWNGIVVLATSGSHCNPTSGNTEPDVQDSGTPAMAMFDNGGHVLAAANDLGQDSQLIIRQNYGIVRIQIIFDIYTYFTYCSTGVLPQISICRVDSM